MKISNLITNEVNQNEYHFNKLTRNKIGFLYIAPVNVVPDDCLACDGYVLKIIDYKKLYSVIGNSFNNGEEESDEFRIPDYNITKRFLQPGTEVGSLIEAGLPDHTHSYTYTAGSSKGVSWDGGSLRYVNTYYTEVTGGASNPIYGNSTTVQPPSQIVHICIKYK